MSPKLTREEVRTTACCVVVWPSNHFWFGRMVYKFGAKKQFNCSLIGGKSSTKWSESFSQEFDEYWPNSSFIEQEVGRGCSWLPVVVPLLLSLPECIALDWTSHALSAKVSYYHSGNNFGGGRLLLSKNGQGIYFWRGSVGRLTVCKLFDGHFIGGQW